jgi:hypothetical protein
MRFMLLIHHDEAELAKAPPSMWSDYAAFNAALEKAGGAPGERLQPSKAAKTLRRKQGKTSVLDGPFADTKEQFAGYFMIDVPGIDEAIEWAVRCPSSAYGSIEIRPMWDKEGNWE